MQNSKAELKLSQLISIVDSFEQKLKTTDSNEDIFRNKIKNQQAKLKSEFDNIILDINQKLESVERKTDNLATQ